MMPPLAYRFSCVPDGLAELTPAPAAVWAERLFHAGAMRRLAGAGHGPTGIGTCVDHMADTLLRYGYPTARYNGRGQETLDPDMHARYLAAVAHRRATRVQRTEGAVVEADRPQVLEHPRVPEDPTRITLGSWRTRFDGRWLVVVETSPTATHGVALQDGELLSGGRGHDGHLVTVAFHFI